MNVFEKIAVVGILGFFILVGMVSATVLDSFGSISGVTEVEGPTFWAGSGEELYLEEQGGSTAGGTTFEYVVDNSGDWYDAEIGMFANVATDKDEDENADVLFNFKAFDSEGEAIDSCEDVVEDVGKEETSNGVENQESVKGCELDVGGKIVERFEYTVKSDSGEDLTLQRYGDTRVEVSAP